MFNYFSKHHQKLGQSVQKHEPKVTFLIQYTTLFFFFLLFLQTSESSFIFITWTLVVNKQRLSLFCRKLSYITNGRFPRLNCHKEKHFFQMLFTNLLFAPRKRDHMLLTDITTQYKWLWLQKCSNKILMSFWVSSTKT